MTGFEEKTSNKSPTLLVMAGGTGSIQRILFSDSLGV